MPQQRAANSTRPFRAARHTRDPAKASTEFSRGVLTAHAALPGLELELAAQRSQNEDGRGRRRTPNMASAADRIATPHANEHPRSSRASLSDLGARLPSNADEDEDAANLQTVPLR
ncbi:hypothetical protein SNOG_11877 [Parastagonospora nodorum SN15]|uniref:Uncharacterized protein n=1 Tax=Phaeosphaeria nodorum (strain SN15 / ATCC MYA-4574 / FGSC 10173) TaxID=321614 RepID=Q0U8N7_PHANO|nr:hypothetical protein SNOG_11877 [Parastagonospora nodorum SN15]EAT80921.1 hypothetical protein SNOG_11877 [Parastagonospora nodorum SN15]